MVFRYVWVLLALSVIGCSQAPPAPAPKPMPSKLEGMWSDPPATAVGTLCFFACTDAAIDRLNALLDDPANDARPFPQLAAEALKHQTDTYLRPRLTEAALKTYPLDPADDPGFLRCEPWGLAKQMFAPHQLETGACRGRRTVVSKPYMCCGGTVPITEAGRSGWKPKRSPAAIVRWTSPPHSFAWETGWPVLPDVNTSAAT